MTEKTANTPKFFDVQFCIIFTRTAGTFTGLVQSYGFNSCIMLNLDKSLINTEICMQSCGAATESWKEILFCIIVEMASRCRLPRFSTLCPTETLVTKEL